MPAVAVLNHINDVLLMKPHERRCWTWHVQCERGNSFLALALALAGKAGHASAWAVKRFENKGLGLGFAGHAICRVIQAAASACHEQTAAAVAKKEGACRAARQSALAEASCLRRLCVSLQRSASDSEGSSL